MNRTAKIGASVAAALLVIVGTATVATAAPSKTYTVSKTYGPYNGAQWGPKVRDCIPSNCEAPTIGCKVGPGSPHGDPILKGSVKINRKTSHGTASGEVLTVDVIGAFWNPEVDQLQWGAWINTTGKKGWNSVTFTLTCRRS